MGGMIHECSQSMEWEEEDTLLRLLIISVIQLELQEEETKIILILVCFKIKLENILMFMRQGRWQF